MEELSFPQGVQPSIIRGIKQNKSFVGSSREMSSLQKENQELRDTIAELKELNKLDPLTGMHNKTAYAITFNSEYGKVKLGEQKSLGVVRMDLDNFSWVNDVLGGHHFGDMYLAVTGDLIRKHIRLGGAAFRVGGDEFTILMGGTFTLQSFDSVLSALHAQINGKALDTTLHLLRQSRRLMSVPGRKLEREGTVAFRELLNGMIELRQNTDGARDHFWEHGRGNSSQKQELLHLLDDQDFSRFEEYLHDIRVDKELTESEKAERRNIEEHISHIVSRLFSRLTISMSGILITEKTDLDPLAIDKKADMMVGSLKRRGGSAVQVAEV